MQGSNRGLFPWQNRKSVAIVADNSNNVNATSSTSLSRSQTVPSTAVGETTSQGRETNSSNPPAEQPAAPITSVNALADAWPYERASPFYPEFAFATAPANPNSTFMTQEDFLQMLTRYEPVGDPIGGGNGVVVIAAEKDNPSQKVVFKFIRRAPGKTSEIFGLWFLGRFRYFVGLRRYAKINNKAMAEQNEDIVRAWTEKHTKAPNYDFTTMIPPVPNLNFSKCPIPYKWTHSKLGQYVDASCEQIWVERSLFVIVSDYVEGRFVDLIYCSRTRSEITRHLEDTEKRQKKAAEKKETDVNNELVSSNHFRHQQQQQQQPSGNAKKLGQQQARKSQQQLLPQESAGPARSQRLVLGEEEPYSMAHHREYMLRKEYQQQQKKRGVPSTPPPEKVLPVDKQKKFEILLQKLLEWEAKKPSTQTTSNPDKVSNHAPIMGFNEEMYTKLNELFGPEGFTIKHLKQFFFEILYAIYQVRSATGYWTHLDLEKRNIMFRILPPEQRIRKIVLPPCRFVIPAGVGLNVTSEDMIINESSDVILELDSPIEPVIIDYGQNEYKGWMPDNQLYTAEKMQQRYQEVKDWGKIVLTDMYALAMRIDDLVKSIRTIVDILGRNFAYAYRASVYQYPNINEGDGIQELLFLLRSSIFHDAVKIVSGSSTKQAVNNQQQLLSSSFLFGTSGGLRSSRYSKQSGGVTTMSTRTSNLFTGGVSRFSQQLASSAFSSAATQTRSSSTPLSLMSKSSALSSTSYQTISPAPAIASVSIQSPGNQQSQQTDTNSGAMKPFSSGQQFVNNFNKSLFGGSKKK